MVKIEIGISIQFIIFFVCFYHESKDCFGIPCVFIYSLLIYSTHLLIIFLCVRDCNGAIENHTAEQNQKGPGPHENILSGENGR